MRLQDQTIIVTGASRGIGRAVAQRCAAEGARVAIAARSERALQETAKMIHDQGGESLVVPTDVTNYESIQRLVSITQEHLGGVDVLANIAGRLDAIGPWWEADPANWWSDVTVNLLGVFHPAHAVMPIMQERKRGRIINMVGGGTRGPFPFASGYACSKAAVTRLTETMAEELSQVDSRVKVFALSPGFVRTRMTEQFAQTETGRKWMAQLSDRLKAGDDNSPQNAAEIVVEIASGGLDDLHGRYLHAPEDVDRLDSLRQSAAGIVEEDARTLRVQ